MPEEQASKSCAWTDEELVAEVRQCGYADTFDGLARRLGMRPGTLEKRLRAAGRPDLVIALRPVALSVNSQPDWDVMLRARVAA